MHAKPSPERKLKNVIPGMTDEKYQVFLQQLILAEEKRKPRKRRLRKTV
jgi:hypothetical protein